jgi:hypothetical protein
LQGVADNDRGEPAIPSSATIAQDAGLIDVNRRSALSGSVSFLPPTLLPGSASLDSAAVAAEVSAGLGLSWREVARLLPPGRSGKPVAPATLWRWWKDGVRVPGGGRVRLEACRLGCRLITSKPALERFLLAQQHEQAPAAEPSKPATKAKERRAEVEAAQTELGRLKI